VRILYLADIRFPLERANGIQSMETCHALALRGHDVSLVVRPDSHTPPRDPFEFYGLPRLPSATDHTDRGAADHADYADHRATDNTDATDQGAAADADHTDQGAADDADYTDQWATDHTDSTDQRATDDADYTDQWATDHTDSTDQRATDDADCADAGRRRGSLAIEIAPIAGPLPARRTGYLTFALGRALGRGRQDLLFTRDLGLASLLLRMPRAVRAPLVYEAHTIAADEAAARPQMLSGAAEPSPAKLKRLAARERRVWTGAEGYVTITTGLKTELERRFGGRSRIAVVPDGVRSNLEPRTSDLGPRTSDIGPHVFTIAYAGHLYPWKGVDLIVEAVMALPDVQALIVGGHDKEPDLARVKALAAQLDCRSRVTFTGLVPPAQVAARLREADVLVLPNPASAISSAFTSPLKLFEYMAAGRPIVACDLPAIREILAHERNALLFEPGNPQALTAAIRRVKEDPALGARLARQAAVDVAEYTWARRAERLEALFAEVLGARRV
jgi:glycosyltransferase involved in cell wall biosynthesis